jgi:hypothetical protein
MGRTWADLVTYFDKGFTALYQAVIRLLGLWANEENDKTIYLIIIHVLFLLHSFLGVAIKNPCSGTASWILGLSDFILVTTLFERSLLSITLRNRNRVALVTVFGAFTAYHNWVFLRRVCPAPAPQQIQPIQG